MMCFVIPVSFLCIKISTVFSSWLWMLYFRKKYWGHEESHATPMFDVHLPHCHPGPQAVLRRPGAAGTCSVTSRRESPGWTSDTWSAFGKGRDTRLFSDGNWSKTDEYLEWQKTELASWSLTFNNLIVGSNLSSSRMSCYNLFFNFSLYKELFG